MSNIHFFRKITQSKWETQLNGNITPIQADAITSDLRTSQNTLSLWSTDDEKDAVIALCSGLDKVEKIQFIKINNEDYLQLVSNKLIFEQTEGKTKAENLKNKHYDIINLTDKELTIISNTFSKIIVNNNLIKFDRLTIGKILLDAIAEKKLIKENLSIRLQEDLDNIKKLIK